MSYVVLARQLAFQKTKLGDPHVPDGPEEIVQRGGFVPEYATTNLVNTLGASGLIVWTDLQDPGVQPPDSEPPAARTPDQPPVLPSDPNGQPTLLGDLATPDPVVVDVEPPPGPEPGQEVPALPKSSDSKDVWENYAQLPAIGMTQGEAEAMNKTDLMAEVKDRYARATA
jgi:hypothetical protein